MMEDVDGTVTVRFHARDLHLVMGAVEVVTFLDPAEAFVLTFG
jgi:hypothetical protein